MGNKCTLDISIQALYDYKERKDEEGEYEFIEFQFKHCTIISLIGEDVIVGNIVFQFKHCTIIRLVVPARYLES